MFRTSRTHYMAFGNAMEIELGDLSVSPFCSFRGFTKSLPQERYVQWLKSRLTMLSAVASCGEAELLCGIQGGRKITFIREFVSVDCYFYYELNPEGDTIIDLEKTNKLKTADELFPPDYTPDTSHPLYGIW